MPWTRTHLRKKAGMEAVLCFWLIFIVTQPGYGGQNLMDDAARSRKPSKQAIEKDCMAFTPESVSIIKKKGRWQVVDGETRLFDAGQDQDMANRVVAVINHYRMNRRCYIGWPDPYFSYLMAKGGVPSGPMEDEQCTAFDPEGLTLRKINERWTLFSGRKRLFVFGRREDQAQRALAIIRRHGFNHACRVGPLKNGFNYLRH